MGFLVSPGVDVNEIDLTNNIPAVSTSIGGFAGRFRWGPTEELITVSSERELGSIFGVPTNSSESIPFLTAASFLKYGSTLLISRALAVDLGTITAKNASSTTASYIKDLESDGWMSAAEGFYAKYPGAIGNSISVYAIPYGASPSESDIPALSSLSTTTPTETDGVHIIILDGGGEFTGVPNTVLEIWENLSLTPGDKKDDGANNYFADVLNNSSSYIYCKSTPESSPDSDSILEDLLDAVDDEGDSPITGVYFSRFTGGVNEALASDIVTALNLFADPETVDVNLLFAEGGGDLSDYNTATITKALLDICEARKDCICFASPPAGSSDGIQTFASDADKLSEIIEYFNTTLNINSSYAIQDSTPVYVYNKYLDVYNWIPACGHMAGLCANTDDVAEPWFSPAGYNRGQLRGITKLAFNPNLSYRDSLYKSRINPIVAFPGQGIILYGDRTSQKKDSAFGYINVRRLFIALEKAIATASKYQLFELNDEFTRAMFRNMVEPFLRDVKGRRGITDFLVVCDETNNTGAVIDAAKFVADIYIKPARSINFITLNFIATRTGVEFSELVGR